jgi:hypothetical protein
MRAGDAAASAADFTRTALIIAPASIIAAAIAAATVTAAAAAAGGGGFGIGCGVCSTDRAEARRCCRAWEEAAAAAAAAAAAQGGQSEQAHAQPGRSAGQALRVRLVKALFQN